MVGYLAVSQIRKRFWAIPGGVDPKLPKKNWMDTRRAK